MSRLVDFYTINRREGRIQKTFAFTLDIEKKRKETRRRRFQKQFDNLLAPAWADFEKNRQTSNTATTTTATANENVVVDLTTTTTTPTTVTVEQMNNGGLLDEQQQQAVDNNNSSVVVVAAESNLVDDQQVNHDNISLSNTTSTEESEDDDLEMDDAEFDRLNAMAEDEFLPDGGLQGLKLLQDEAVDESLDSEVDDETCSLCYSTDGEEDDRDLDVDNSLDCGDERRGLEPVEGAKNDSLVGEEPQAGGDRANDDNSLCYSTDSEEDDDLDSLPIKIDNGGLDLDDEPVGLGFLEGAENGAVERGSLGEENNGLMEDPIQEEEEEVANEASLGDGLEEEGADLPPNAIEEAGNGSLVAEEDGDNVLVAAGDGPLAEEQNGNDLVGGTAQEEGDANNGALGQDDVLVEDPVEEEDEEVANEASLGDDLEEEGADLPAGNGSLVAEEDDDNVLVAAGNGPLAEEQNGNDLVGGTTQEEGVANDGSLGQDNGLVEDTVRGEEVIDDADDGLASQGLRRSMRIAKLRPVSYKETGTRGPRRRRPFLSRAAKKKKAGFTYGK